MARRCFYPSLTRITPLSERGWTYHLLPSSKWANGDYVLCQVDEHPGGFNSLELPTGRMVEVTEGDRFIGALGERRATLEVTGSWQLVGEDGQMQLLTSAGLLGAATSKSPYLPDLVSGAYLGHVMLDGEKATMRRFVPQIENHPFSAPIVLMIGTSMSAGKTTASKVIIRRLQRAGLHVLGAKLTGAGRYRDILSMADAGADCIFDFVDVGLPSTVCPEEDYRRALNKLLSMMAAAHPDVAVVEIGASPLEPYNGTMAIEAIREAVKCTVLAASDPYAAYGVMHAFDIVPDFVCGVAVNTDAAERLTEALCGVPALNVVLPETHRQLDRILSHALGIAELATENTR